MDSMKTFTSKIYPEVPTAAQTPNESKDTERRTCLWCGTMRLLMAALISAALWGGGTHIALVTVQSGVNPLWLAWLCETVAGLCFLLCRIVLWVVGKDPSSWKTLGLHSLTPLLIIKRVFPLCSFSLLTFFLYVMALHKLCAPVVATLYSCSKALCYLLSWTVLREQFLGTRVVGVICCTAGVVMMSYHLREKSFKEAALIGWIFALSAAALQAVKEVLFHLMIGCLSLHDTVMFWGLCGFCNVLLLWWIPLAVFLQVHEAEYLISPSLGYLCGTSVLFVLFQLLEKTGGHFFPGSGVSLGVFFSVAVTIALEMPWNLPSVENLLGISAVGVGIFLLIIPEDWQEHLGLVSRDQGYMEDLYIEIQSRSNMPNVTPKPSIDKRLL